MKIYTDCDKLISQLKYKYLFFDTNSIIAVLENEKLRDIIVRIGKNECTFFTIPSVVFELSRTAHIDQYNARMSFVKKYLSIYYIERHFNTMKTLIPILHRIKNNISYTDFLLYGCLYNFQNAYLISENHKDLTTDLLDREYVITIDDGGKQIRNTALYTINYDKYHKAAEGVLKKLNDPSPITSQ